MFGLRKLSQLKNRPIQNNIKVHWYVSDIGI